MCGITGIIKKSALTQGDETMLAAMNAALKHRGPDSGGSFADAHVALAMRRLSIIDLTSGNQPFYSEDRKVVLIANGEIYNYVELRKELEACGRRFQTKSDCETVLHAYEEYGEDCIKKLRGMFAFCLYDSRKGEMLIVRDRVGEKPLYLLEREGEIAFSSEMKSLIGCLPEKDREIDEEAFYIYLHYGYLPEPRTLVKGIRKLPASSLLHIKLEPFETQEKKYWSYETIPTVEGDPAPMIRKELEEIERIIIRSDVPVGISLSGGIDSSLIAALSAKYSQKPLHAFSVGYAGTPENDERAAAKALAAELGIEFHDIEISGEAFLADFDRLVYEMDDPIADIAAYGYYRVAKEAQRVGVPVLLTGFGGDELFWGYQWMRDVVRFNTLKQTFIGKVRLFLILLRKSSYALRRRFWKTFRQAAAEAFSNAFLLYDLQSPFRRVLLNRDTIFDAAFLDRIDPSSPEKLFNRGDRFHPEQAACQKLDEIWLSANSIALGDRTSMAHSIEMRLPLLDYRLIELAFGLQKSHPGSYRLSPKKWLVDAVHDLLPNDVLNRKKRGFQPPTAKWMASVIASRRSLVENGFAVRSGMIRKEFLAEYLPLPGAQQELLYRLALVETWIGRYLPKA